MLLVKNKKAKYDFDIKKTLSAGIVLNGAEVKSLRNKSASLNGSYVKIINNEAWLINAQINPYQYADQQDYDPKRSRKLLLTKKQIFKLKEDVRSKNLSLVPLSLEMINNRIKLKIGVGKGQREFEKRSKLKREDLKRRMAREFKRQKLNL
jgi:SsrA-binding protein